MKQDNLFEILNLKNEPRTEEQIHGVLDKLIGKFTEKENEWIEKLIERRENGN